MKILVIQQKMIGDVLSSSIICENIKQWNSNIKIDFIANRHTLPVIENNPYIDETQISKVNKFELQYVQSCNEYKLGELLQKYPEFLEWKWIDLNQITELVVDFKLQVYQEVKEKVKNTLINRS